MITDPLFYGLAFPAVLLIGISKGGFGGGLGLLAMPVLALVIGPIQTAAIMLPILCAMDVIGVGAYRRDWDRANMKIMIPGALVGIAIGAATFSVMSDRILEILVGLIAVGFTLQVWTRDWLSASGNPAPARGPALVPGLLWSALSGFTSFIANAGGPPVSVYLLPQRLDKTLFQGTTVIFFFLVNLAKLPPFIALGLFTPGNLWTSLALLPAAPVGIGLGIYLHRRVSGAMFYKIVYVLLFLAGLKLMWNGFFAPGIAGP